MVRVLAATLSLGLLGSLMLVEAGAQTLLDPADQALQAASRDRAWTAAIGAEQRWANPVTGSHGTVTTLRENPRAADGRACREAREVVTPPDRAPLTFVLIACRSAGGPWQLVTSVTATTPPTPPSAGSAVAPADLPPDPNNGVSADPPHTQPTIELRLTRPTTPK